MFADGVTFLVHHLTKGGDDLFKFFSLCRIINSPVSFSALMLDFTQCRSFKNQLLLEDA